jgi:hypothetical protein
MREVCTGGGNLRNHHIQKVLEVIVVAFLGFDFGPCDVGRRYDTNVAINRYTDISVAQKPFWR